MFSSALIGFLAGVSAAAWVYTKTMRRTGNNTKNSATLAALAGGAVFVVVLTIMSFVNSATGN